MTEEIETQENNKLPVLRGELALLVVVLINSLGVVLMLYSAPGSRRFPVYHMHFRKYSIRSPLEPGPTFSRDFWCYH